MNQVVFDCSLGLTNNHGNEWAVGHAIIEHNVCKKMACHGQSEEAAGHIAGVQKPALCPAHGVGGEDAIVLEPANTECKAQSLLEVGEDEVEQESDVWIDGSMGTAFPRQHATQQMGEENGSGDEGEEGERRHCRDASMRVGRKGR